MQQARGLERRWRWLAMVLGCLVGLVALAQDETIGPLRQLETASLDWRFRLRGERATPGEIMLLVIDEATITAHGGWPLPRPVLADAIERLDQAGARAVALNLLLTETARGARRPNDPGDAELRGALIEASPVILPMAFGFAPNILSGPVLPKSWEHHAYHVVLGARGQREPPQASHVYLPASAFLSAAPKLGHVSLALADDGILRSDLPVVGFEGALFPSFGVAAVSTFLGVAPEDIVVDLEQGVRLGDRLVPFDHRYRHYLNYYGDAGAFRRHSLGELLDRHIPRELFAGRLVLIGVDALGLGDRFPTPFAASLSGVDYLATSAANMIDGSSLRRGQPQILLDVMIIIVGAGAAATISARGRPVTTMISNGVLLLAVAVWSQAWFVAADWWLSFAYPVTAIVVAAFVTELARTLHDLRVTRRLERDRATLARHFAPQIVEEILMRDYRAQLDRSTSAAVMFVDLAGFTTLCETMRPAEAIAFLRDYHRIVETVVFHRRGMIANFAGDGVMCAFGLPDAYPECARNALLAAQDLVRALHRWRVQSTVRRHHIVGVGVGVHFGPLLMGNVGGERQLQFTAIGDTVNSASRLQSLTRELGVQVLVSDEALHEAGWMHADNGGCPASDKTGGFRRMGPVTLRGRQESMVVWGWSDDKTSPVTVPFEDRLLSSNGSNG